MLYAAPRGNGGSDTDGPERRVALGNPNMTQAIELDRLSKTYPDGTEALHDLSLALGRGEVFGFLGPNGAGKTTTIKMLLGFTPPTSGTVRILGGDPLHPDTRRQIGYLPEVANYYPFMTVEELLRFYGRVSDMPRTRIDERIDELVPLVGLAEARRRQLKHYSKGMLQRAGIAQALLHDPDLLILDEPTTGLDPLVRMQMRDIIQDLRAQGKTVFFSSHELSEAELICDRVGILRRGRLCWCGPTKEAVGDGERNLERAFLQMITAQPEETEA